MGPEDGVKLGRKALKQIAQVVRDSQRRMRSSPDIYTPPSGSGRDLAVILDGALAAASDSKTGSTSAIATVCNWEGLFLAEGVVPAYVETGKTITVWNHSESTDHAIDTFGYARWVDGHWVFFGDCDAMGAR